jgi:hypothetical protein
MPLRDPAGNDTAQADEQRALRRGTKLGDGGCSEDDGPGRDRLAFVHVPKTAGTSVSAALARHYGAHTLPAMTTLDYQLYDDTDLVKYRFYKGHAYRRDYERLPADTVLFTILRDPVRRALSYYAYARGLDESGIDDPFILEASQLAKNVSPVEFIYSESPFVIEHLRLGQMRQFLPDDRLAEIGHRLHLTRAVQQAAVDDFCSEIRGFAYVLTVECLDLSFPLMIRALGLPHSTMALGRENVSAPVDGVNTADLRRALMDVSAVEFDCYAYVRRREQAWLTQLLSPLLRAGK